MLLDQSQSGQASFVVSLTGCSDCFSCAPEKANQNGGSMHELEMHPDWPLDATADVLPMVTAQVAAGKAYALATIVVADGGPRPVGSQMVITKDGYWGFVSGGCVEADVARHARDVLATEESRRLIYGWPAP